MVFSFFIFMAAFWPSGSFAVTNCPAPQILASQSALQLVVATTQSWDSHNARVQYFERKDTSSAWIKVGANIDGLTGKNGMAWGVEFDGQAQPSGFANGQMSLAAVAPTKKEGDGKAPAGDYAFGKRFGIDDSKAKELGEQYIRLQPTTYCVDDPTNNYYNKIIDTSQQEASPGADPEKMYDYTSLGPFKRTHYDNGIVINYNSAAVSGRGSCIFLHIWPEGRSTDTAASTSVGAKRAGTAGCLALEKTKLERITNRLDFAKHPALVQMPRAEYARWRQCPGVILPGSF